jgi:nitroimidazol reductase NimA-like FMN-containing flavoprotein (pyridoxamine 5'-phosphate oxidase superfamily)
VHAADRTGNGPQIFPVNYALVEGEVVYRTRTNGPLAMKDGHSLGFEVDHLDEVMSRGWSVLIAGRAERITDPEIAQHLSGHVLLQPWAGGERELFIRVHPERVTGRRIVTGR